MLDAVKVWFGYRDEGTAIQRTKNPTKGKDAPLCINFLTKKAPYKGLGADSEEKHEPVSDIDTAVAADSLKALDPERPIREAEVGCAHLNPHSPDDGLISPTLAAI